MVNDCFADEIAIDFPSVDPVVERMRDAFLGEREDDGCIRADLVLSSREASRGLVVPVEVPMRGTCQQCGGRGETWMERCEGCAGTGGLLVRRVVQVTVPPRVVEGTAVRFRVCSPDAPPVRVELRIAISELGNRVVW
jgi:hypothetical protein